MEIDDDTLMALADGEITGDEAARLHSRIADDPDLAARYALFSQTAGLVKAVAMADPAGAVSPELEARIRNIAAATEQENVVPMHSPARNRPAQSWQPVAIAASLALAVGLSAGLYLAPGGPQPAAGFAADLTNTLDTMPAGAQDTLSDGARVTIIASFTDEAGTFCREYETTTPDAAGFVNVACRSGDTWDLRFAMAKSGAGVGYTPAASLAALDAFYASKAASPPLAPEEERQFLK